MIFGCYTQADYVLNAFVLFPPRRRFQTTRSGRLVLHTDIRMVISRRTDCDTAAAHAKGVLEAPNELKVVVATPEHPRYSLRLDKM